MTLPSAYPHAGAGLLVVGGCGGIGWSVVEAARELGLAVRVLDLPAAIERRGATELAVPIDVRSDASVNDAFAALDESGFRFRFAVNAFGGTRALTQLATLERVEFDDLVAMNMGGLESCLREELRRLGSGGAIVNLTTGISQLGIPGYAAYASAKAGVNALTRIAAVEGAPHVRVNAVAPGATDTAFLRGGYDRGGAEHGPAARVSLDEYVRRTPLGRVGTVEDVVGPILFLLSDAARYVTGQVLHVNGGAHMRD